MLELQYHLPALPRRDGSQLWLGRLGFILRLIRFGEAWLLVSGFRFGAGFECFLCTSLNIFAHDP